MLGYILRRLILIVPTLIGVTVVVFFVMALAPGGFGGVGLNEQGSQDVGVEAKRIQQQFMRRYGFDQPYVVQYGRWLNQVSPLGFTMSADYPWPKTTQRKVRGTLGDLPAADFANPAQTLDQLTEMTLQMAGYSGAQPVGMARRVHDELQHPDRAMDLFKVVDGRPFAPQQLKARLGAEVQAGQTAAAQRRLIAALRGQVLGRSRVMFSTPHFKWPDLGQSLRGRAVTAVLATHVPITILLNLITLPIIYIVAIASGVYAGRHRGGVFDVTSGGVFLALWSVPVIWAGIMAIGYLANERYLRLFPTGGLHGLQADAMPFLPRWTGAGFQRGWLLDASWHLVLPVACMVYGGFAILAKVARGSVLDNLQADYVRTARAKGVGEKNVLWHHVFRNSTLPLITLAASILPALFTGSVVVENIFSINGMGKLAVEAAFRKDRELIMGVTLISGLLMLATQLLRDVIYALADPRVSYE